MIRHCAFVLILLFVVFMAAPFLGTVAIILWLIRRLVSGLSSVLNPKTGKLLSGMDGLFACENPYESPQTVIQLVYFIDGHVSLEEASLKLSEIVGNCEHVFPELAQYLSTWIGFAVWKPVENFQIQNHVRLLRSDELQERCGESEVTDENVFQIGHEISSIPFYKNSPPWELIICHSLRSKLLTTEGGTVFFLRMHHTLGDGNGVMRLTTQMFKGDSSLEDTMKVVARGEIRKGFFDEAINTVFSLVEIAKVCAYRTDFNVWHLPWTNLRRKYVYQSITIPTNTIKRIRRRSNVAFSAIVTAAITGAIRRFLLELGEAVPEKMHGVVSIPLESKNSNDSNNITSMVLEFPTGATDPNRTCQRIHSDFMSQRKAAYPLLIHRLASFVAMMPQCLKCLYPGWCLTTCGGTNYPGFLKPIAFNNKPVVFAPAIAQLPSNIGIYFWSMGYGENLTIAIGISKDIAKNKESGALFMECLEQEIQSLEKLA